MKERIPTIPSLRIYLLSFAFLIFSALDAKSTFEIPASDWYKQGFSLPESVEISKEGGKEAVSFADWLRKQPEKKQKKILAILHSKGIKLPRDPSHKKGDRKTQNLSGTGAIPNKEKVNPPSYSFLGGSYQLLDTRYLPLHLRNHSSLFVGQTYSFGKWIFEKRDSSFVYGMELNTGYFHFYSGQRYKPMANFYFAKDQNFFSNFDRKDSFLPQPLNESYFAGINFNPNRPSHMLGIYSAKSVSPEPGFYYVSPNKSYSTSYSPHSKIVSIFMNDTYKNIFSSGWISNLQGEGIGRGSNYTGFVYLRNLNEDLKLKLDLTAYRDNQLIALPTQDQTDKPSIKQDLGYSRIRYREYFLAEGLASREGLRLESGYGFQIPVLFGDWGAFVIRYRGYAEDGFYQANAIGRGFFYEYRNEKTIVSIGNEYRDKHFQTEGKVSVPISETYFFELSCLYRDSGIPLRSWFENWSYATDFNVNLVDRREIWKLKLVGPEVSLNLSISEKIDSPTYIYYANFQFNQKF